MPCTSHVVGNSDYFPCRVPGKASLLPLNKYPPNRTLERNNYLLCTEVGINTYREHVMLIQKIKNRIIQVKVVRSVSMCTECARQPSKISWSICYRSRRIDANYFVLASLNE